MNLLRQVIAGAGRRRAFDPLSLSPSLWLDASDASRLFDATSGGSLVAANSAVARWEDKSGNNRHATNSVTGERPTRIVAAQNGRDVVRFAPGANRLTTGLSYIMAEIDIFVVWEKTGSNDNSFSNFGAIIGGTGGAGAGARWAITTSNAENRVAQFRNSSGATPYGFASSLSLPSGAELLRLRGSITATTVTGARNGAALSGGSISAGTSIAAGDFMLGSNGSTLNPVGDYMEVLIFGRHLTTDETTSVINYLAAKWGVAI